MFEGYKNAVGRSIEIITYLPTMSNLQLQARSLHHNALCPLLPVVVRASRPARRPHRECRNSMESLRLSAPPGMSGLRPEELGVAQMLEIG